MGLVLAECNSVWQTLCANSKPHSRLTCESLSYCQYKNNTQLHYSLSKLIFLSLSWIPTFFLRYVLALYDHKVQFCLSIFQRTQTVRATLDGILVWRFQLWFSNTFSQKKRWPDFDPNIYYSSPKNWESNLLWNVGSYILNNIESYPQDFSLHKHCRKY